MTLTDSSLISKSSNIIATEIDEEVVIMHIENGRYYGLDNISTHIWQSLDTPIKLADLVTKISQQYAGDPDCIRNDIIALIEDLQSNKLIETK